MGRFRAEAMVNDGKYHPCLIGYLKDRNDKIDICRIFY